MFRFEIFFWFKLSGFSKLVNDRWHQTQTTQTPQQMHDKLQNLQKGITTWVKDKGGNIKIQLQVCRKYIRWVDQVEEVRILTKMEKKIHRGTY